MYLLVCSKSFITRNTFPSSSTEFEDSLDSITLVLLLLHAGQFIHSSYTKVACEVIIYTNYSAFQAPIGQNFLKMVVNPSLIVLE